MKRAGIIGPLIGLVVLSVLETDLYLASFPSIASYFQISELVVQTSFNLYLLIFSFGILALGPISDRFGRKPTLLTGLSIGIIGTMCILCAQNSEMFLLGRALEGIGGASGTVLGRVMARELFSGKEGNAILAYLFTGVSIGIMVSPALGGFINDLSSWHSVFYAILLFQSLLILSVSLFLPESRLSQEPPSLITNIREVMRHPPFRYYTLLSTIAWSGFFAFAAGSSFFIIDHMKLTPSQFGSLFALVMTGMVLGTFISGKWLSLWTMKKSVTLSMGILILSIPLLFLSFSWIILTLAMFLYQLGMGMLLPLCQGEMTQEMPHLSSLIFSLLYFSQMLGATLAGFALSLLTLAWPLILPYFIAAFALSATALYFKIVTRQFFKPTQLLGGEL